MKVNEQATRVAARLEAVDWKLPNFLHSSSRVRLMREYLRRSALWARELAVLDLYPFFDVTAQFDPVAAQDNGFADSVLDGLLGRGLALPHRDFCRYMLNFAVSVAECPDLPDPYEPLLQVYERGGGFDLERGVILIDHTLRVAVWPADRYLTPELSYDISPQALADIDAKHNQ
ncbi:hypothetical protein Cs7R123_22740 [Catellatospora sp. TT07R-123]|uniref:hypothetical protein n=1 Tax=Catellatospora sp. TT07R-123 TaxID=2733863 RepID=UPI001B26AFC4|nr:hypothetical protein [Catellatospora sp. TT07R-123]GHJ44932.1 hypothetical protein Cs7R123_22740 [Catellatospora sp. TT07R-123]